VPVKAHRRPISAPFVAYSLVGRIMGYTWDKAGKKGKKKAAWKPPVS